jgi:4-amino-4-deoxy-L-arabinose transferase-like glycosyltransferase
MRLFANSNVDVFLRPMQRVLWIIALALLLLSRVPVAAEYLSIDNVNLAFALDRFAPQEDQPQPPGYPFFVAFARVFNIPFHNADRSFFLISLLVSGLCLPAAFALGSRVMNRTAGYAAAFLLLFNPAFWQAGLEGPLRPNLTLFSLLTAYCCWRAWEGETRFVLWGALALGIGSGFRPDLLIYLFPLWFFSAAVGTRSFRATAQGLLLMVTVVAIWVGALALAVGGIRALFNLVTTYLIDQSRANSVLLGAETLAWRRQVSRLLVWNGMAVIGWLWALPFAWGARTRMIWRSWLSFLWIWVTPGLVFQALVHVGDPGHTLFSVPAWCVLGGVVIAIAAERLSSEHASRIAAAAVSAAMVFNVLLFLNQFPLPVNRGMLLNAAAYGALESSIARVQYVDEISRTTMKELKELTPANRPWVIVSTDDQNRKDWFINWRIVRYYVPDANIWVAADQQQVLQVRRDRIVSRPGSLDIPVPRGGRVIWLLEKGGALHQALIDGRHAESRQRLLYTDIPTDGPSFQAWGYTFSPQ